MDISVSMASKSVQFWSGKALQRAAAQAAEVQRLEAYAAEVQRLEAHLEQQLSRQCDPEQAEDAALAIQWLIAAISEFHP